MNVSRITVKGQATIPVQIRKFMGISAHDLVRFRVSGGKVVLDPVKKTILDFKGAFRSDKAELDYETVRRKTRLRVAEKISGYSK